PGWRWPPSWHWVRARLAACGHARTAGRRCPRLRHTADRSWGRHHVRQRGTYCGPMPASPPSAFPASLVRRVLAAGAARAGGGLRVLGISGLQGSGKSTLAAQVTAAAQADGLSAARLSLDDVYLTAAQRRALAAGAHPLLSTRGPPGTHDVALALATIDALRAGRTPPLPRFDKLGDDRLPEAHWPRPARPLDLLVLEGWCLGVPPESDAALQAPINAL